MKKKPAKKPAKKPRAVKAVRAWAVVTKVSPQISVHRIFLSRSNSEFSMALALDAHATMVIPVLITPIAPKKRRKPQ